MNYSGTNECEMTFEINSKILLSVIKLNEQNEKYLDLKVNKNDFLYNNMINAGDYDNLELVLL